MPVDGGIHMMVAMTRNLVMILSMYSINFKISLIVYNGTHVRSVEQAIMLWVRRLFFPILISASTVKAAHDIYVWERAMGSLIKILEGPKEELIDVDVSLQMYIT